VRGTGGFIVNQLKTIQDAIAACSHLSVVDRVAAYNAATKALGELVRDIADDPACSPQLVEATAIEPNAYNPNRVAAPEMDLLENSMRADGITMPVVVMWDIDGKQWTVVDGFHRRRVAIERLGRQYVPCSVLDKPMADRMASTVRHNRARGKHVVDLMAELVKGMMALGWDDDKIAENLGMSVEELLRLRQMVGAAKMMADAEYSREWGVIEAAPTGGDEQGDDE
jgi:ParB-like chromosome segregation protein Spo0J